MSNTTRIFGSRTTISRRRDYRIYSESSQIVSGGVGQGAFHPVITRSAVALAIGKGQMPGKCISRWMDDSVGGRDDEYQAMLVYEFTDEGVRGFQNAGRYEILFVPFRTSTAEPLDRDSLEMQALKIVEQMCPRQTKRRSENN